MDVPGVGARPAGTDFSSALRGLVEPKGQVLTGLEGVVQPGDAVTAVLRELAGAEIVKFLGIIERPPTPETVARLEGLLRASISSVSEGNVPQALVKLAEFAALNPSSAEALEADPGLVSIRQQIGQLLSRLASTAHLDAESRLGQATQLLETVGSKEPQGQEFRPEIAILIAGRLLEAGGYANCVRSAELSQMAINQYGYAPAPAPLPVGEPSNNRIRSTQARPRLRRRWAPKLRRLWRRAPLLVLLLAWFAVGFVGGAVSAILRSYWPHMWPASLATRGFEVWGIGFLALIGFGFYARVRNWRAGGR